MPGEWSYASHRMCFQRHRRYLAPDDTLRKDPLYGAAEEDDAPAPRTHAEVDAAGKQADAWRGPANQQGPANPFLLVYYLITPRAYKNSLKKRY
jgi:hypothetical protein